MRDKIKDEQYFDEFIKEDLNRILNLSKRIEMGDVRNARIVPVKHGILRLKLGIIIAKYSKGDDIEDLKLDFTPIFKEWIASFFSPNAYNENLKMISLAILFNIEQDLLFSMKKKLIENNINDWLYNFLLDDKNENTPLLFSQRFHSLKETVDTVNKDNSLEKYLKEEWYNKDCEVFEAHKSSQKIYYGYWSFEAGAVAKILHLDDSSLKDAPYYPYDLVHYKEEKTVCQDSTVMIH